MCINRNIISKLNAMSRLLVKTELFTFKNIHSSSTMDENREACRLNRASQFIDAFEWEVMAYHLQLPIKFLIRILVLLRQNINLVDFFCKGSTPGNTPCLPEGHHKIEKTRTVYLLYRNKKTALGSY